MCIYIYIIYNYTIYIYIIIYDRNLSFKQSHERVMIHFRCEHLHGDQGNKAHQWHPVAFGANLRSFFAKLDLNHDGKISFPEFRACLGEPEPTRTQGNMGGSFL